MSREQSIAALALTCGVFFTVGCGATTSGSDDQGAAGGGTAGGGTGATTSGSGGQDVGGRPSDGGGGTGGAVVTESPLEPGSCGIVRTIQLPQTPPFVPAPLTRQGTSFALGPWKEGDQASRLVTLVVDESGESRSFEANGSTNDVSWSLFLTEPALSLEVLVKNGSGGAEDSFESRAWTSANEAPRPRGNLVDSIWRGTDVVALAPTLDGRRGVFAIWPLSLAEPRAAVIGADGARLGDSHTFPDPEHLMRCSSLTPTARGGYVSFVDSNDALRVYELGSEGQLLRQATWPMPSDSDACPAFALEDGGLAFLLDRAGAGEPADMGLYRLDAEGVVTQVIASLPGEAREVTMLGGDPLVLRWSPQGAELIRPRRDERWLLTLPAGTPKRVPSEPGNIVLDFETFDTDMLHTVRTLVQVSCR